MTIYLALDETTNDLIKGEDGGYLRVQEGRYTIQLVRNKLQTRLTEWALDPTVGWLDGPDFGRNPDLFDIELRARQLILSCQGVQSIDEMSLELSNRVLTLTFSATTIYGGISLTVPWGI